MDWKAGVPEGMACGNLNARLACMPHSFGWRVDGTHLFVVYSCRIFAPCSCWCLKGTELRPEPGEVLIQEDSKCSHFYFILEGEVGQSRNGISLAVLGEGAWLGESALFGEVKERDEEGHVRFTTQAVVSPTGPPARLLKLSISDFLPLVYHEHPGATAIVQRLGRLMVGGCI